MNNEPERLTSDPIKEDISSSPARKRSISFSMESFVSRSMGGWGAHSYSLRIKTPEEMIRHEDEFKGYLPNIANGFDEKNVYVSKYPSNCSIVIISEISGLKLPHIKAMIEYLSTNPRGIWHDKPTCIQVTVNNHDYTEVFIEAGFKIIHEYQSNGSLNHIYVLAYKYDELEVRGDDEDIEDDDEW